jgi:hypothetical protein
MPANDPKVYEPVVLDQTENNQLSLIADAERKKLITRNDFKKNADEYGVTNPQALADGDDMGRGTGVYLDVYNNAAGTNVDIAERKNDIKFNKFNQFNTYPNF